jgi:hypothetical protein
MSEENEWFLFFSADCTDRKDGTDKRHLCYPLHQRNLWLKKEEDQRINEWHE